MIPHSEVVRPPREGHISPVGAIHRIGLLDGLVRLQHNSGTHGSDRFHSLDFPIQITVGDQSLTIGEGLERFYYSSVQIRGFAHLEHDYHRAASRVRQALGGDEFQGVSDSVEAILEAELAYELVDIALSFGDELEEAQAQEIYGPIGDSIEQAYTSLLKALNENEQGQNKLLEYLDWVLGQNTEEAFVILKGIASAVRTRLQAQQARNTEPNAA